MTSCKQLKDNFFFFLFHLIIEYFVRERLELSIGIYISMKSAFFIKSKSLEKMVKTSKFVSQKQNKQQKKKLTSNNKKTNSNVLTRRETIAL